MKSRHGVVSPVWRFQKSQPRTFRPPLDSPYGTVTDLTFGDQGICGDLWDDPTTVGSSLGPWNGTCGSNAPYALVNLVLGAITQRQAVGCMCSHAIIAFDPNSFKPDGTSSAPSRGTAYPDGNWGQHTKYDASTHSRITARNGTAIYWLVPQG
jgi:hypothetical protein